MSEARRNGVSPGRRLAIVADDLTGAADAGAAFAARGLETIVCLCPPVPDSLEADVLVVDTDSRELDDATAARRAADAARAVRDWGGVSAPVVYKKIDSTLRGPVVSEVAGLATALNAAGIVVCPAFPDQGRTTVGGRQLVDGVPVEGTMVGRDVATSDLCAMFAGRFGGVRHVPLSEVRAGAASWRASAARGVTVVDAETDQDLGAVARIVVDARVPLVVGSAGLARAIAAILGTGPRASGAERGGNRRPASGVLTVAGSRNPVTLEQVREAERRGVEVLRPDAAWVAGDRVPGEAHLVARAVAAVTAGRAVIIATGESPRSPLGTAEVARRLASVAARIVVEASPAALVLTGGETAAAVCAALDSRLLTLDGEVAPGVATGRLLDGAHAGLRVITKAGGFGDRGILMRASTAAIQSRGPHDV